MNFSEEWGRLRAESTERITRGAVPAASTNGPAAPTRPPERGTGPTTTGAGPEMDAEAVEEAREAVLERLAHFRSTPVLVPLDAGGGLWTADFGGLGWICAFADEPALARFAEARGDTERAWPYRTVLGSRLLDEVVPAVAFPCGVALNAAGPDGAVFPPVRGIVPDTAAVDSDAYRGYAA
ncbi:hypothetical protein ACIOJD_00065 [Streptomyces sp. NPDC088116]|uniref:hypothetical protein n=1 Tax=Streptomyces sp. NPDC088116 TaxID=3365825 RepID=UPI0038187B3F